MNRARGGKAASVPRGTSAANRGVGRVGANGAVVIEGARGMRYRVAADLGKMLTPIAAVQHHERNARKRTPRNIEAIRASFDRFGQQRPLLVYHFAGEAKPSVISGNGGLLVATQLGWTHVATSRFNGTSEEAEAFAVADNRSAELSEWETAVLTTAASAMRADETLRDLYGKLRLDQIVDEATGTSNKPEIPFTTELLEKHDYVVFTFSNELDWQVVVQHLGIASAHSLKSRPGFEQIGIGRVIDGAVLLDLIKARRGES